MLEYDFIFVNVIKIILKLPLEILITYNSMNFNFYIFDYLFVSTIILLVFSHHTVGIFRLFAASHSPI